jgi:hypothetical protein
MRERTGSPVSPQSMVVCESFFLNEIHMIEGLRRFTENAFPHDAKPYPAFLMYGRADGMPSSPQSMVVCDSFLLISIYIPI